jgi:rhodanese-related sulfurtransferase
MVASVRADDLFGLLAQADPPLLIDARRSAAFRAAPEIAAGALRREPASVAAWASALPASRRVVVYCARGHEVSQTVARELCERGLVARYLEGGLELGWKAADGPLVRKPVGSATRWVTRERPKIDRAACPWLIARFIDAEAEFIYAPPKEVLLVAEERTATPYDVPDVEFSHEGERCTFDALLQAYRLADPALERMATILRGADTGRLELAPQSSGLLAISLGLSRLFADDHEMLRHALVLYDALHLWCRDGQAETHTWNPAALR